MKKMLWCDGCQQAIREDELETAYEYFEDVHASRPYLVCPECGGDAFTEAAECAICGDFYDSEDNLEQICDKCKFEIDKKILEVIDFIREHNYLDFDEAEQILWERMDQFVNRK